MLLATAPVALSAPPVIGDGRVFATVPESPGYPETVVIDRGRVYVTAPAAFGTAGRGPSVVHVYRQSDGQLLQTIALQGENLSQEHAVSGAAVDRKGRLYVASTQLGVVRLVRQGNQYVQQPYSSPFPDLNPADPVPPLPNEMAFDRNGFLYVPDSLQATIWRIPPGGGAPQAWFQSPLLAVTGQSQFGPNGVRLSPGRKYLYFSYTGGPATAPGELPQDGRIYRIRLGGAPLVLEEVYRYSSLDLPDGISFDRQGRLYVALAGSNAISVLETPNPDGAAPIQAQEANRIIGPAGSPIPFVQPSTLAFNDRHRSVLVVNHALFTVPPPNLFAVLEVYVDARGDRLEKPAIPSRARK